MFQLRFESSRLRPGAAAVVTFLALAAALVSASVARAQDSAWPRQFGSSSGTFVIYQPQPEDLTGDVLSARAAFSLQKNGSDTPTFGVLWFTEQIQIDRDSSTVSARQFDVTKVRLPGITPEQASEYEKLVENEAVRWDLSGSLDELRAGLAATEKERASISNLANTPPRIVVSYERAILVTYDGAPMLEAISGSNLQRVTNTPFAVISDPATHAYYLNGANLWYSASDPLGPWTNIGAPPRGVADVVPPDTSAVDQVKGVPPLVMTATEPTELIAFDGKPQYAPLVSDQLLYVTNTEADVIREIPTQSIYVLLSGRWFRASSFNGPWKFVRGDQLPMSFRMVPPDSPKGNILASVSGTDQSDDAIADAEIPQTTAIQRNATDLDVMWDGLPQFEPIAGTNMRYGVNTASEVIEADGMYYVCDQGVWFISESPNGPWRVSETRPLGLDDIPPSCPVYDTRYVYIYEVTPMFIYMGYVPGYIGCHPYYGTVVYGTGYHYRPWRGHHYYPRPCTWGYHARYNPWLSRWSFGFSYSAGFLRVGYRWHSGPPSPHRHAQPLWFGPGGYRRPVLEPDMTLAKTRDHGRARPVPAERIPANIYNRPENVARVERSASRLPVRPVATPAAQPAKTPNNVFAGKDGKVYQRGENGQWQVNEGHAWHSTPTPNTSPAKSPQSGGVTAGGNVPSGSSPKPRPQPMPAQPPTGERSTTGNIQRPRPVAPAISPVPGNLEREFRARQRVSEPPQLRPQTPAPHSAPAQKTPAQEQKPKAKPQAERKP
jgi:hypothetical protein